LDAIHVFCIDPVSGKLTAHGDIKDTAGSGPRHGVFWKNGKDTYYFLVHELSSMITSFKVEYLPKRGLGFTKVDEQSSYGNKAPPAGAAAAEIQISPCGGYVLASNRNVTLESIANPDTKNATKIESDSIVTFKTSPNGKLKFHQLAPSGGKFPRHFSLNKDGSMVAVANQQSYSVDLYARDINTGMMGKRIASAFKLTSNPNNVNFVDE
jgi:6-phosphogluconolactonase (cycloisomerase 2 family)